MKKLIFLTAVLLLVPAVVIAGMAAITDTELQEVEGQTGITIDMTLKVTSGNMAWTDYDGINGTDTTGAVCLRGVSMPDIEINSVVIDAGTSGSTSYLAISTGTNNLITGNMSIGNLVMAHSSAATAQSLGGFLIEDVGISFGTIKINGH